jgi:predicted dehydrogenase
MGVPPDDLELAVIGCGAVAEAMHLPAIARCPGLSDRTTLVDLDVERASMLSREFRCKGTASDYRAVLGDVDAAYITAPHHLHYPIALDCLRSGVHVLCEKPLAETAPEARELIEVAEAGSRVLAVNNTRRFYPAFRKVSELLAAGEIGALRRFSLHWGEVFDWPAATGFYFGAAGSARGVLADTGAHALDLVCWWLGGKPELLEYLDDSFGGSEAVARLRLRRGPAEGEVQLSWLSKYENRYELMGEAGAIEGGIYDWRTTTLVAPSGRRREVEAPSQVKTLQELADELLADFLRAVSSGSRPLVSGLDVLPSIELIEECYGRRGRFEMSWMAPGRKRASV